MAYNAPTSPVFKFGFNDAVGTSFVPVAYGGVWQTPQPAGAKALRIKAGGDANDSVAGTGARQVTIEGIDETGALVTESVLTAGASASSATTATFIRLLRAYVSLSGTYGTTVAGSHADDIVIEASDASADWGTIPSTLYPRGQSEIACYSTPTKVVGAIKSFHCQVESTQVVDIMLLQRQQILDAAPGYQAVRVLQDFAGVVDAVQEDFHEPGLYVPPNSDIIVLAKVASATGRVFADFVVELKDLN